MWLIIALVLAVLWVGGFTVMHVTGFAIHILIILAVVSLIAHFVTGRRAA